MIIEVCTLYVGMCIYSTLHSCGYYGPTKLVTFALLHVSLQNGANALMLACFADFGEVLTALVEEFGMDVTAKDFVCAMGLHHTLSRTYIHILHALSGVCT